MQLPSKSGVEPAFARMGEILYRAHEVAGLAIFGSAAILLQFGADVRTGEPDARVESGDHGAVLDAP